MSLSTEAVWTAFREPLRNYVARRVPEPADADDVLQEVFVRVHTHLGSLEDESRLVPWLYRIARSAVVDRYRRRDRARPLPEDLELPAEEGGGSEAEEPDVARAIARSLRGLIAGLPELYREALVLSEFEGLTQREVAARLGLSLTGAKSRIQRGRKLLKKALLECCHFDFDQRGRILEAVPRAECCRNRRRF